MMNYLPYPMTTRRPGLLLCRSRCNSTCQTTGVQEHCQWSSTPYCSCPVQRQARDEEGRWSRHSISSPLQSGVASSLELSISEAIALCVRVIVNQRPLPPLLSLSLTHTHINVAMTTTIVTNISDTLMKIET